MSIKEYSERGIFMIFLFFELGEKVGDILYSLLLTQSSIKVKKTSEILGTGW